MAGIDGDFFNKFLTAAQKAKVEQAVNNDNQSGVLPIDNIEEYINENIFDITNTAEIEQSIANVNIFNLDPEMTENDDASGIFSQLNRDMKNNNISDSRISEIVNTVEDYENLLNSITNGKNYLDDEEYSREYDLRPQKEISTELGNIRTPMPDISGISAKDELKVGSEAVLSDKNKEENSLLKEENHRLSNYENGSVINNEKDNSRSYYNLDGGNTANLGSMKYVINGDEANCYADYNGMTSDGKIVKGKIIFDVDEHTGTLNGKPIKMDSDTGVITFQNPDDAKTAADSEKGNNTAKPVGISSLTKHIQRDGSVITSQKSLEDESVSYYSDKGNKIAQTENKTNFANGSYSTSYTGYDSKGDELAGLLVFDSSNGKYKLDGKPCEFDDKTGKITFEDMEN